MYNLRPLQVIIVVLFVLERYNHGKCTTYETFADNHGILFVFKRYNHVKCTTYETVTDNDVKCITYETLADNDCGIICINEI